MNRQLTADEQGRLETLVHLLQWTGRLFKVTIRERNDARRACEGIFKTPQALENYVRGKLLRVTERIVEPYHDVEVFKYEDTTIGERLRMGFALNPEYNEGFPVHLTGGPFGAMLLSEPKDTLGEGTADRLDLARNARRSRNRRKHANRSKA